MCFFFFHLSFRHRDLLVYRPLWHPSDLWLQRHNLHGVAGSAAGSHRNTLTTCYYSELSLHSHTFYNPTTEIEYFPTWVEKASQAQ